MKAGNLYLFSLSFAALFFLTGCEIKITNLTPTTLSENPTGIYTISASIKPNSSKVIKESIRPHIVIDGQTYPLEAHPLLADVYEFEYELPHGRVDASYYFLVNYKVDVNNYVQDREEFSNLQPFKLANRYALALEVNRAPVGSQVGIVGRGFRDSDVVEVGGTEARTTYHSSTSVGFHVPSLQHGRDYPVRLRGREGSLDAGSLRVDAATVRVAPQSVTVAQGARTTLVFSISSEAPPGGFPIDVTTDIPESIILPEVVIPEGARSVNIPLEGGRPGSGHIYVEMPGIREVQVPVTVQ